MRILFALAVMVIASLPSAANAIDCARASSHLEHMICEDPKLVRADAAMNRAYAAILKAAPDPEIRAMLVTSQKRWIAARDSSFGDLDKTTDGMTGEGYSKALQHSLVLHATVDRTRTLGMSDKDPKQPRLIAYRAETKAVRRAVHGRPVRRLRHELFLRPAPGGRSQL